MNRKALLDAMKALSLQTVSLDWTAQVDKERGEVGKGTIAVTRTGTTARLTLRGVIGTDITAAGVQAALSGVTSGLTALRVDIASKGGDIDEATQIVAMLADLPSDVSIHTRAVGVVASAATLLLAAGDKRTAIPQAQIMVHGPHLGLMAIISYASIDDDFARLKAVLTAGYEMMRITYENAGIKASLVKEWLSSKTDVWLKVDEAQEAGLLTAADDITNTPISAEAKSAIWAELRARKLNGIAP